MQGGLLFYCLVRKRELDARERIAEKDGKKKMKQRKQL